VPACHCVRVSVHSFPPANLIPMMLCRGARNSLLVLSRKSARFAKRLPVVRGVTGARLWHARSSVTSCSTPRTIPWEDAEATGPDAIGGACVRNLQLALLDDEWVT